MIHSQDILTHQISWMGEIDYVVIIPKKGVVCIEIKACREPYPKIDHHGWFYSDDQTRADTDGPFVQIKNNTQELRKDIVNYSMDLRDVIITRAVFFTDAPFTGKSTEWLDFEHYDINKLGNKKENVFSCIKNTIDKFRLHCEGKKNFEWFSPKETNTPSPLQVEKIIKRLRPKYENILTPEKRQKKLTNELKEYTEEQYNFLDLISNNERVLVNSPAGTGKTVLAIEAARRANDREEKTLFICFNKMLGNYLENEMSYCKDFITFKTFSKLLLELSGIPTSQVVNTRSFWSSLPDKAFDGIENNSMKNYFDHLIIDEAQDIMGSSNIIILSSLLSKGFNKSKLTIFGDFEWQSLYKFSSLDNNFHYTVPVDTSREIEIGAAFDDQKLPVEKIRSEYCQDIAIFTPRINCRNTPAVAKQAELYGGMKPGYKGCLRFDDRTTPVIETYKTDEDQIGKINTIILKLRKQKFNPEEIVILSYPSVDESIFFKLFDKFPEKVTLTKVDRQWKEKGSTLFTSIRSFKGLESAAVIISDIPRIDMQDKMSMSLLYTGITRSIDRLFLLVKKSV